MHVVITLQRYVYVYCCLVVVAYSIKLDYTNETPTIQAFMQKW